MKNKIESRKTYTVNEIVNAGFEKVGDVYGMSIIYQRGNERIFCDNTETGLLEVRVKYLYQVNRDGTIRGVKRE